MENRPIPALYCCYLLRFKQSATQVYIGSTPNPRRRLAQHLGHTKGGARRTARSGKAWTMTCIVTGFPSKIAALQFEWAWSNPHLTKRIADEDRLVVPVKRKTKSRRSDKVKEKIAKPSISIQTYLSHLHLLLRGPSFKYWPLQLRFFSEDVFQKWNQVSKVATESLRTGITASLDLKQESAPVNEGSSSNQGQLSTYAKGKRRREAIGKGGVDGVDVEYTRFGSHVTKSTNLLNVPGKVYCILCSLQINDQTRTALVCPSGECHAVSHLTCLASSFRRDEGDGSPLLPTCGKCPTCGEMTQWIDLVTELSLRARGDRDIARLLKKPKRSAQRTPGLNGVGGPLQADPKDEGDEPDEESDDSLPEDWHQVNDETDDGISVSSSASNFSDIEDRRIRVKKGPARLSMVIEDSEWDEADALD